jgi:nucleoside-diphosphate-sugar epimerase
MKRVLVTGAQGFLGHASMRALQARGWDVVGVSRNGEGPHLKANLLDASAVRSMLNEVKPTHLLHAAWRPVHGDVMRSPENLTWLASSLNLVKFFHDAGGERVAVIGTSAEYDWTGGLCRNNVTPLRPATLYGAAKHALHLALASYAQTVGLSFVWPRMFDVYGPGEHETRLATSVIRAIVRGEPAKCTHGSQVRDYLHIDDVGRGIVAALESEHQGAIDIASGQGIAVRDLVLTIARALGREDLVQFGALPAPDHDVSLVVGDPAEAEAQLGWKPRIELEDGVRHMVAWGRTTFAVR